MENPKEIKFGRKDHYADGGSKQKTAAYKVVPTKPTEKMNMLTYFDLGYACFV